ncbi:uncharacterized protein Z519_02204 [Cladophialophora bantiana CBS 173.52]|uniref:Uncharacterized protein n=1 Tax=Cladophialophora bantiana (strain ATCC 10958 / CBS 173.52 / CDC B-1940 / NIH 8579) TaxID=1442370 RepID=A0A0D2HTP4_CLAB1|nr:uncharacterized protein Z519_02204 [Cladophialophora bantiana CBS 173.52]KIW96813.1 hypothetical protein Z519_02204 [Cladophialophora bantiana CBS 173.52]
MDSSRLEIDQHGYARAVLEVPPTKKRLKQGPRAPELVIDDRGYARAVLPTKKVRLGDSLAVHLRIGLYSESYERTQFQEEDLEVKVEEVPLRASRLHHGDSPLVHPTAVPQNANLPLLPAPSYHHSLKVGEIGKLQRCTVGEYQDQQEMHQASPVPLLLPPVIWIKRSDEYTRLRYAVDVLTINGEKYVRLDETHFLFAVNAHWLQVGENVTIRQPQYRHWQAGRCSGRPEILFMLYPLGKWAYTPINNRRKKAPQEFRPKLDNYGRVLLNAFDRPLKFSNIMPEQVSTEIEGWEMEAICRLDPDICHQDFIDRILPNPGHGKVRPSKGTLNHRRRRDRIKMRILPWPLPRQLSYSDQQVINGLTEWQMENNTTRGLRDLLKEEIEMQEAIMYGGHFERSGANAQNDEARLERFWANLMLVRTKFAEDSEEVRMIKNRIAVQLAKMGLEYHQRVRDTGADA